MRRRAITTMLMTTLVLAGCGGGDSDGGSGDGGGSTTPAGDGKELFVKTCGSCHTLTDADTSGAVGPKLDGLDLDESRVATQIERGGGGMPSGLLEGADKDAVASYVAEASSS